MKKIWLFLLVGLVCSTGAQSATFQVSGGTGLQAAIDGASAGDTIEIIDSATYTEDIFINKDNLTLIGTGGSSPTILAANNTLHSVASPDVAARGVTALIMGVVSGLLAGGASIPDQFGLIIEASGCTLQNLIIQNNGPALSGTFSGALSLVGNNNTITDCTIRGPLQTTPGVQDNEFCLSFVSGNWPELDVALGFVGLGNYFANGGYSAPTAAQQTTLNNCILERSTNTIGAGDYSQFFYNAITAGYLNSVVPFNIVFNNCTWSNAGDGEVVETGGVDNVVLNNCLIDGNPGMFDVGGGTWVYNNTVFSNSTGNRLYRHDAVVEFGGGAADSTFNNCLFCGNSPNNAEIITIQEGGASFNNCIFNATQDTILRWEYNNWDGQFATAGYPTATQIVTFDHCDIYNPNASAATILLTGGDTPDAGQPGAQLVMTNNIVTGTTTAVEINATNLPPGGADLSLDYNDFLVTTVLTNTTGWTETSVSNNLSNVAPGYTNAGGCTAADYSYANSALTSAGQGGTHLGSQSPPPPPGQSVEKWEIYK